MSTMIGGANNESHNTAVFSMPPMPVDMVNAIVTIKTSMEIIMTEAAQAQQGKTKMTMTSISNMFFRRCGIPAADWTFCDSLFIRYFAKFSKIVNVGKVFASHATCFLVCILLMGRDELIRLVIDVYTDGPTVLMSYDCFGKLLYSILDTKTGGNCDQLVSEFIEKFRSYASSNPLFIRDNKDFEYYAPKMIFPIISDSSSTTSMISPVDIMLKSRTADVRTGFEVNRFTGRKVLHKEGSTRYVGPYSVSTNILISYCSKKAPNSLWPLTMFQSQLRKIFLGEEFWMRWQQEKFFVHLHKQGCTSDVFVCAQTIFKVYTEALVNLPVKNLVPSSGTCSADSASIQGGPLPTPPAAGGQSNSQRQNGTDGGFVVANNLHVLLIEDSKSQRKIMMKRLQLASGQGQKNKMEDAWVVGAASSGEEALSILQSKQQKVDVVICDENLGGSGGILLGHEVVKIMRETLQMTDTVIIGCTSNTKAHTQALLEAGADAVWPKPMPDNAAILAQVAHFLSRRHFAKAAPEDTQYPTEKAAVAVSAAGGGSGSAGVGVGGTGVGSGTGRIREKVRANQGGRIKQIILGR